MITALVLVLAWLLLVSLSWLLLNMLNKIDRDRDIKLHLMDKKEKDDTTL